MAFLKHKYCFIILIITEMKKFIYSFAVIAALGLVACGGSKTENAVVEEAPVEEAAAIVEETIVAVDSNACCQADSCCQAEAPVAEAESAE